jgi:hypothetical protein
LLQNLCTGTVPSSKVSRLRHLPRATWVATVPYDIPFLFPAEHSLAFAYSYIQDEIIVFSSLRFQYSCLHSIIS